MQDMHRLLPVAVGVPALDPLEEVLIPDARAGLSPSEMVDRKLQIMLRGSVLARSQGRMEAFRMRGARPVTNHFPN
jgi:hypothetical protein